MDQRERLHEQVELTLTNRPLADLSLESRLETISAELRMTGHAMVDLCPPSRELSLALTSLQEARMMAVAAIVLHQERIAPRKIIEAGSGRRTVEEVLTGPDVDPPADSGELRDDVLDGGQPF